MKALRATLAGWKAAPQSEQHRAGAGSIVVVLGTTRDGSYRCITEFGTLEVYGPGELWVERQALDAWVTDGERWVVEP